MIKWSLILPSRERVGMLTAMLMSIASTTDALDNLEVIVSIDEDDQQSAEARTRLESQFGFVRFIVGPRRDNFSVHYYSEPASRSSGKYVMALNDDVEFLTKGWDSLGADAIESSRWPDRIVLGQCEDNLRAVYPCFPVLTREALEKLTWFFHPEFATLGADVHLHRVFSELGRIVKLPFEIKHSAPQTGLRVPDTLTARCHKLARYNYGSAAGEAARLRDSINSDKSALVIVNTFRHGQAPNHLKHCIDGWKRQRGAVEVVVSDCLSSTEFMDEMRGMGIRAISCREHVPVYVTFNMALSLFGAEHSHVLYCAEDVVPTEDTDLAKMLAEFDADTAIVSALVDQDVSNFYGKYAEKKGDVLTIALGESVNMHCFAFSAEFLASYGNRYPDILTAFATESLLTFLTAAIGREWRHCRRLCLRHERNWWGAKGFMGYNLFRSSKELKEVFEPGTTLGLGFETCQGWFNFNPKMYDEHGRHVAPKKLRRYILDNLFLTREQFDYENEIKNLWRV